MKIFTRFFLLLTVAGLGWAPAQAARYTVLVGKDGANSYEPATLTISAADEVEFKWASGFHPTQSDSNPQAWQIFEMNSQSTSRVFPANSFASGITYPYHCTVHGYQGGGMAGTIKVNPATVTATEDARLAALSLNLYPNPSRGYVTVQLRQKPGPDYKLRLFNVIGQEIRSVALRPDLSAAGLPLDLSSLPGGIYFYSLVVDGKVASTKRLILQN